jgi:hypothetical protein
LQVAAVQRCADAETATSVVRQVCLLCPAHGLHNVDRPKMPGTSSRRTLQHGIHGASALRRLHAMPLRLAQLNPHVLADLHVASGLENALFTPWPPVWRVRLSRYAASKTSQYPEPNEDGITNAKGMICLDVGWRSAYTCCRCQERSRHSQHFQHRFRRATGSSHIDKGLPQSVIVPSVNPIGIPPR